MRSNASPLRFGRLWLVALLTIPMSIAACSGGTAPVTRPPATVTQALSPTSGGTALLPASGGITGASVTFPGSNNLPSGVSVTFKSSSSLTPPTPQSKTRTIRSASATAFWQMTFTGSTLAGVTFSGNIVVTIPTPSGTTASNLVLEIFDGSTIANTCSAAASASNTVFTCANPQLNLGDTYWIEVVSGSPLAAAYCSNYSNFAGSGVPLNITDDSGLVGAVLVVYVTNGTYFMDNTGSFSSGLTKANPLPAACFSTTSGSSSTTPLVIPSGVGGRVYLAYATPNPSPSTVPNPFGNASVSGPNVGYSTSPYPWDKIEYGTTAGATIDTTQVDALGLPLELSVGATALPSAHRTGGALPSARRRASGYPTPCATDSASSTVGVTSCNYALIFQAMEQVPQYNDLVVTQNFNGSLIDLQVVAPKDSVSFTSFQWNLFALAADIPTPTPSFCPGTPTYGYISCVLASYDTSLAQGRLFQTNGIGASGVSGHNYCATSDGSTNFVFTDVGSATSCTSATANPTPAFSPNPFMMPMQEFTYGVGPASDVGANAGCTQAILFSQPWGNGNVGSGHIFAQPDAFALWKDLTADLNRGTTLTTTQTHPVGLASPSLSLFFQDPMFNTYAQIIHTYFNGNLAYALAYDDLGNFESGVIWQTGDPINVRINAIPAASATSSAPAPVPLPSPCPALPINVGT